MKSVVVAGDNTPSIGCWYNGFWSGHAETRLAGCPFSDSECLLNQWGIAENSDGLSTTSQRIIIEAKFQAAKTVGQKSGFEALMRACMGIPPGAQSKNSVDTPNDVVDFVAVDLTPLNPSVPECPLGDRGI